MLVNTIIFSLNRACQLHALLESWHRFVSGPPPKIIYAYTDAKYREGYEALRKNIPQLPPECWIPQVNFRIDTLAAIEGAWHAKLAMRDGDNGLTPSFTMFLVDDIVFRRRVELELCALRLWDDPQVACYSLRLSPKITHCYSHGGIPAPAPLEYDAATGKFPWPGRAGDWGYPMSTDGHIFRTVDLLNAIRPHVWSQPNTLEMAMCHSALHNRPYMLCSPDHAITNVPQNLVQGVCANRNMEGRGLSAEVLNERYLGGEKIDINPLIATETNACHAEQNYQFVERVDGDGETWVRGVGNVPASHAAELATGMRAGAI